MRRIFACLADGLVCALASLLSPVPDVPEVNRVGMAVPGQGKLPAAWRRDFDFGGVDLPGRRIGWPGRSHNGFDGIERMTCQPQRHPVPGRGDNPQDLVGERLGVTGHQRVSKQESRYLFSLGERIPDGRGIRRRRPPRCRSQEQRRRTATAAGIGRTLYRRRTGRSVGLRTAAVSLCSAASTSWRRSTARRAGRKKDGTRRGYQAGNPRHAMTISVG